MLILQDKQPLLQISHYIGCIFFTSFLHRLFHRCLLETEDATNVTEFYNLSHVIST